MNNIKLCVFDIDGTLIDTREFIVKAFEYTLEKHGLPVPSRETIIKTIGKPLAVDYQNLTGLTEVTELCTTHRAYQNENHHLTKLFPNVIETLQELRNRGIKIATETIRSKITSAGSLKEIGLDTYIDLSLAIEDVESPKPSPSGTLKIQGHFNIPVSEILLIGDRPHDIEAGKAAGVKTVGVSYGNEGNNIIESEPDYVIDDIKEILDLV